MLNSVEPLVEEGLGGRAVNGTATPAAFAGPRGGGMVAGGAVSPIVDPVVDPNPSVPEVMAEPGGVGWYDWFGGERGPPVLLNGLTYSAFSWMGDVFPTEEGGLTLRG